uniref:Uncharacterized protein n=1 Tax=Schizaphis graminum TaxID=13262 RepID=A0A2S2PGB0_SCHGA
MRFEMTGTTFCCMLASTFVFAIIRHSLTHNHNSMDQTSQVTNHEAMHKMVEIEHQFKQNHYYRHYPIEEHQLRRENNMNPQIQETFEEDINKLFGKNNTKWPYSGKGLLTESTINELDLENDHDEIEKFKQNHYPMEERHLRHENSMNPQIQGTFEEDINKLFGKNNTKWLYSGEELLTESTINELDLENDHRQHKRSFYEILMTLDNSTYVP